jgi:hypothetical protein
MYDSWGMIELSFSLKCYLAEFLVNGLLFQNTLDWLFMVIDA